MAPGIGYSGRSFCRCAARAARKAKKSDPSPRSMGLVSKAYGSLVSSSDLKAGDIKECVFFLI